jgi:predicted porin
VGKYLVCALAITGLATAAHAADLSVDSLKDPLPDKISYAGVTLYGTIDVGGVYQSKGAGLSGDYGGGIDFQPHNYMMKSITTPVQNALETSKVGIKIEEGLGYGWTAIGKLETGFNPLSGELINGPGSLVRNAGLTAAQTSNGDSSMAGQLFNRAAWGGISNPAYGTLTVGRQNSLIYEAMGTYDPQGLSNAFSIIGYSGFGGGAGDTGLARWDNSVKYLYTYGPVHVAGEYSAGGADTDLSGHAWGADGGFTYKGLSVDAIYQRETGAASLSALSAADVAAGANLNSLAATISDNAAWSVQGKYTFDLARGGFKDEAGAKITLYGGYEHIDMANPGSPVTSGTALGGYNLYTGDINNTNYYSDRKEWIGWLGASYATGPWTLTAAYYHYDQAAFLTGSAAGTCAAKTSGNNPGSNCAGTENEGSFVVDYRFDKHFDVYTGVNYAAVAGGLAHNFENATFSATDQLSVYTGLRLKF